MDIDLFALATSQHGVITTSQARILGWDRKALAAGVRRKQLVHLARSLYAAPAPSLSTPEGRHRALCRGAVLLYPDAVLSHASAVLAHGLPLFGPFPRSVYLQRPVGCQVRTQQFVIRPVAGCPSVQTDLGSAVPAPLALLQHTLDNGVISGLIATDAALHGGLVEEVELRSLAEEMTGWPRSGRVATVLALMDRRTESGGETRLRLILRVARVAVTPQALIRDEYGQIVARVDFAVDGTNVVIEFDGMIKYFDGGPAALVAEKNREDRIRRLGHVVVRVTWPELDHPIEVVRRIHRAAEVPGMPRGASLG